MRHQWIPLTASFAAVAVLATAAPARAAFAWALHDFGATPFDHNNNWSPVNYPGIGHLPSPGTAGEGGELYDLESFFVRYGAAGTGINIAVASSFGSYAHSPTYGLDYRIGDIFLDLGGDGSYDFAIDRLNGHLYSGAGVSDPLGITDMPGSYYGNAAIRDEVGAFRIRGAAGVTDHGSLTNVLTHYLAGEGIESSPLAGGNAETYVYEAYIPYSLLAGYAGRVAWHQTEECGNDLLRVPAVPEPGTLLLLASGLLGSGALARRRRA